MDTKMTTKHTQNKQKSAYRHSSITEKGGMKTNSSNQNSSVFTGITGEGC